MERDPQGAPEKLAWDWRPGQEEAGVGKASCNGSCMIDAASYFERHFLNYGFGWGEQGAFALQFFVVVLFFALRGLG